MRAQIVHEAVKIETDGLILDADLRVPDPVTGVVVFAHGTGSSRFSSRNRAVAGVLEETGFATLLLDLLTTREEVVDEMTHEHRFNIDLLGRRVVSAADWVQSRSDLHDLPVGFVGASTGAAAALIAAAERPDITRAVISRGGRPDLAHDALPRVQAPTLLIVGGNDGPVIQLIAWRWRRCTPRCSSRSSPGQPICSKSQAPCSRSRASPPNGVEII